MITTVTAHSFNYINLEFRDWLMRKRNKRRLQNYFNKRHPNLFFLPMLMNYVKDMALSEKEVRKSTLIMANILRSGGAPSEAIYKATVEGKL